MSRTTSRRGSNISPAPDAEGTRREPASTADLTQHRDDIVRYLTWQRVPASAVDELTQDVFLVAHRRRAEFRGNSSLKTWLTGIAFHLLLNWRRRRKYRQAREVFEGNSGLDECGAQEVSGDATTFDPLDELLAKELCTRISEVLGAEPDVARRLWLRVVIDEIAIQHAAGEFGLSEYQARQVHAKTAARVRAIAVRQVRPQLSRAVRGAAA